MTNLSPQPRSHSQSGFSLLEMLVSTTVLVLIMGVVLTTLDFVSDSWRRTTASVETFENARAGFIKMNDLLSQATLNTYADYYDEDTGEYRTASNTADFVPTTFKRQSELHFFNAPAAEVLPQGNVDKNPGHAIFFQAPLSFSPSDGSSEEYRSVPELLNSLGFYVEFYDDSENWPAFVKQTMPEGVSQWRFRLMQWIQPTTVFNVYSATAQAGYDEARTSWFKDADGFDSFQSDSFVIAENVVMLIILPKLDRAAEIASADSIQPEEADGTNIAPNYQYDSRAWEPGGPTVGTGQSVFTPDEIVELTRNQLPPLLEVVMVAIDEKSAARLANEHGNNEPLPLIPADSLFQESNNLDDDLTSYTAQLAEEGLNYRVFRNTVAISSAKWSPDT